MNLAQPHTPKSQSQLNSAQPFGYQRIVGARVCPGRERLAPKWLGHPPFKICDGHAQERPGHYSGKIPLFDFNTIGYFCRLKIATHLEFQIKYWCSLIEYINLKQFDYCLESHKLLFITKFNWSFAYINLPWLLCTLESI